MEELLLQNIPLFSGLDRISLAKLIPEFEKISYKAGDVLFHKGDVGNSLYIIIQGMAIVFIVQDIDKERHLAYLGPGDCVGEMALITGERRSASVRAKTDLMVFKLSNEKFNKLLNKHHFLAIHLTKLLSNRLKNSNENNEEQLHKGEENQENCFREIKEFNHDNLARKLPLLKNQIKNVRVIGTGLLICGMCLFLLKLTGLSNKHILLLELLLAATLCWSFNILSFRLVSVSLPVATVLLGLAEHGLSKVVRWKPL